MARYDLADIDGATLAPVNASGAVFYELGMMYASGRSVPADLVSAHKWFNLAAMRGHADAIRLRREIAAELTDSEIGQAQRAARDWLKGHVDMAPVPQLRAAA
jgi:TPR repeat protein